MKKTIIFTVLLILLCGDVGAKYVRKPVEPEFFIPENVKFNPPEKLPAFKIKKAEKTAENMVVNYDVTGVPNYKLKYNEYIDDIRTFYSTGEMPVNEKLNKDLAEMTSDEAQEVDAPIPDKLISREWADFYMIYKRILEN